MANKIRCSHILVAKFSEAQEILEKIRKGESFAKLAQEKSLDGSRKRGGDLGYFGRGTMVKEFERAAFSLEGAGLRDSQDPIRISHHQKTRLKELSELREKQLHK